MKGWLVYTKERAERNRGFIDWFLEEATSLGIDLQLVMREELTIGIKNHQLFIDKKPLPDFAIVRCIDPLFSQQLNHTGIAVFNPPEVASITNDKARTHQFLAMHQIPMVDTIFMTKQQLDEAPPFPFPFVVKSVNGHGGKNVYMVENKNDRSTILPSLSDDVVVQRMAQQGKDVRVYVLGNEIIGAVLRSSHRDFRSNFTLGGNAELYQLSEQQKALTNKIISLFDFGLVGIDFVFDEHGGFLLNEIEDVVGCRMLTTLTDINIARRYLSWIQQQLIEDCK